MSAESENTLADFDAFRRFLDRSARRINRRAWETWYTWGLTLVICVPVGWLTYVLTGLVRSLLDVPVEAFPVLWRDYRELMVFPVILLAFFVFYMVPLVRGWRPYHRFLADGDVFAAHEIAVAADGIRVRSKGSRHSYAWSRILAAVELPGHFVLMLDWANGITIPKRCLADGAEIARLGGLLERYADGLEGSERGAPRDAGAAPASLEIQVKLDRKDLQAAGRCRAARVADLQPVPGSGRRRLVVVAAGLFYLAFLGAGFEFFLSDAEAFLTGRAVLPFVSLIVIVFFVTQWYIRLLRGKQRPSRPIPGGLFLDRCRYDFDRSGLATRIPGADSWYGWPAFLAAFESADHFFLMLDRLKGVVLPKRAFADTEALDGFRTLVVQEVGEIRQA